MSPAVRVGFVVHPARAEADEVARRIIAWCGERGIEVRTFDGDDTEDASAASRFVEGLTAVVSVGGDGTFLRAAHLASHGAIPVLGVKVGRLGFLTAVEPGEATDLLGDALLDGLAVEERIALRALPVGAPWSGSMWALNEVIVEKATRHRLVRLNLSVGGEPVTSFSADGVIVATPTGSTAYSFSAGGPIVSPAVDALVVTPVAAHMVFDRSFVVPASATVRLEVVGDEPGLVSADGRTSRELPVGAAVEIGPAPHPARFVVPRSPRGFHALVRERFGLPGAGRDPDAGPVAGEV